MSKEKEVYSRPASMEPLSPGKGLETLSELCARILFGAGKLSGQVHSPVVLSKIAELVQGMNCYYSNLIEGHQTTPLDIERAFKKDFSEDPKQQENQLLGLAHIETEREMRKLLSEETDIDVYSPEFICSLHESFYSRLPESLHFTQDLDGKQYRVHPGKTRDHMVGVGAHTPPHYDKLSIFLSRFASFYTSKRILEAERLIAISAAHHRLAWIHPFGDGNGRVTRLHTQALLIRHGIDSHGLWSLSRGLARAQTNYYSHLARADKQRKGALDGRGNLSDTELSAFCHFFLETALDQIEFMSDLLELPKLRRRIETYFMVESERFGKHSESLAKVVRVLIDEGQIDRSQVRDITGKKATTAAEVIKLGLDEGVMTTTSTRGPLRIAFPEKTLSIYFPKLYSETP